MDAMPPPLPLPQAGGPGPEGADRLLRPRASRPPPPAGPPSLFLFILRQTLPAATGSRLSAAPSPPPSSSPRGPSPAASPPPGPPQRHVGKHVGPWTGFKPNRPRGTPRGKGRLGQTAQRGAQQVNQAEGPSKGDQRFREGRATWGALKSTINIIHDIITYFHIPHRDAL